MTAVYALTAGPTLRRLLVDDPQAGPVPPPKMTVGAVGSDRAA
jgi:hypothetical protein